MPGHQDHQHGFLRRQVLLHAAVCPLPGQDHQEAGAGRGQGQGGPAWQDEEPARHPHRPREESAPGSPGEVRGGAEDALREGGGAALATGRAAGEPRQEQEQEHAQESQPGKLESTGVRTSKHGWRISKNRGIAGRTTKPLQPWVSGSRCSATGSFNSQTGWEIQSLESGAS